MKAVTSEIIFNILKAHLKHEPDWKIIELTVKMQKKSFPGSRGKPAPDFSGHALKYHHPADLAGR